MNSESNMVSGAPVAQHVAEPAATPWWRVLYWSLRRELWESRSIYLAPVPVALLAFAGFLISLFHLSPKIRAAAGSGSMQLHDVIHQPFEIVAGLLMGTTTLVAIVYCADALYGERRDRSILFWKSLPVSDTATVLAKASIPILILPLLGFAITFVLQLIMAAIISAVLAASGLSVATFWEQLSFAHRSLLLLYHLVAVHGLSWAPVFGWLLLVSAWARRAPLVWALLPPVAIGIVEKIAFGTTHLANMLGHLLAGTKSVAEAGGVLNPMTTHVTLGRLLTAPDFWIGLALTAVFLAAAVRLRRSQVPN